MRAILHKILKQVSFILLFKQNISNRYLVQNGHSIWTLRGCQMQKQINFFRQNNKINNHSFKTKTSEMCLYSSL